MSGLRLPFNDLQKAVYDRLDADLGSTQIFAPVAPSGTARPYVAVTNFDCVDVALKGRWVFECTYEVHVWTDVEESLLSVNTLMSQAATAITRAVLSLGNGFREDYSRMTRAQVTPEVNEAGLIQHGTLSFISRVVDTQQSM